MTESATRPLEPGVWHRLHPLSPFVHAGRAAIATVPAARDAAPQPKPAGRRSRGDDFTDYYRRIMDEVEAKKRRR